MDNVYASRVRALRELMFAKGWDAIVITASDPHSSEYPAPRWKQVRWLSGFGGEAGDLVITADHAGLWTDTRYFIAANACLPGTGIELHKTRVPEQVLIPDWLARHFAAQGDAEVVIAVDGLCVGAGFAAQIQEKVEALQPACSCEIVSVPDLLGNFWTDRPGIPSTPIYQVDHGESRSQKLAWIRGLMDMHGCSGILLTALDEIAWMLNVRASDVEYNPLVISYLLISRDDVAWFVVKDPVEDETTLRTFAALDTEGVRILPYSDLELELQGFEGPLFVDPSTLNYHIYRSLAGVATFEGESPVQLRKAVKNPVEIKGMRDSHDADGLAMERFLYWLEKSVEAQRCISEWDASAKLTSLRADSPDYLGDSFETISAYGPGGALPHYVTPRENAPILYPEGLYLCDSGGQYTCGTTDITRTVPLGTCTRQQMEDYTLVLKCHIDLETAVFPYGTPGCRIDVLAREALWRAGRNFGHGTGHGVGCQLGVHEGPHELRQNFNSVPLEPGMILTDEPGIYREGSHGVRHENQLLIVDAGTNEFGHWLRFESLTLCHIDTSAILVELMDRYELEWLNNYNEKVYQTYKDRLPREMREWLREKTLAI